jgi:hypothetical protein
MTTKGLQKIPVSVASLSGADSDGDGLTDSLESALHTNPMVADTDNDGFSDADEILKGFNPLGTGKLPLDEAFVAKQTGKIILQVEDKGEAWYIFPVTKKRYYLGSPADALAVMRELGLGITNRNLKAIPIGQ